LIVLRNVTVTEITSADTVWSQLLVWRDANGDGVSAPAELTAIAASTVASINLLPRKLVYGDSFTRNGNAVQGIGNYTQDTGFSAEAIAARFVVGMADVAQNGSALGLFSSILAAAGDGSTPLDPLVLQGLIDQAVAGVDSPSTLSPFLARYAALDYDFASDTISGDVAGFIDTELASFTFDPAHPWAGWREWAGPRSAILSAADPDGHILDERRPGNQMLGLFGNAQNGLTTAFARVGLEGKDARDLRISFAGRTETVMIHDYTNASYTKARACEQSRQPANDYAMSLLRLIA
jgi:hypothetical protein